MPARALGVAPPARPYFSGVETWYSATNESVPIDLLWSERYQPLSQGARLPVFERAPAPRRTRPRGGAATSRSRTTRATTAGRSGAAASPITRTNGTTPRAAPDPRYAQRPELADFRWRDTDGCLKVRPDCLALLDEFVAEQARKKRRVQYDVRETKRLDRVPLVETR